MKRFPWTQTWWKWQVQGYLTAGYLFTANWGWFNQAVDNIHSAKWISVYFNHTIIFKSLFVFIFPQCMSPYFTEEEVFSCSLCPHLRDFPSLPLLTVPSPAGSRTVLKTWALKNNLIHIFTNNNECRSTNLATFCFALKYIGLDSRRAA